MALDLKALKKSLEDVDAIITPRYTSFLLQHGDEALPTEVADIIHDLLTTPPRYRGASFSASSAGACWREQVFNFLGLNPGGGIDAQLQNIFNDGKWRHLRWQAYLLAAGILSDIEDPLEWPAKRSRGTMDGSGVVPNDHPRPAWRNQEFGFELKGVSTFQFATLKSDGPLLKHKRQVARYFLASGFPLFVILYEDKTTQAWKEWVIEADDPEMKQLILEQRVELEALNVAVDTKVLPPMLDDCQKQRGPIFNKECPYGGRSGRCVKSGNVLPKPIKKPRRTPENAV